METQSLSSCELLNIWEKGQYEAPPQRALMLLAGFCKKKMPEDLARLPIGVRDALLLSLREKIFGQNFSGLATCPGCGQWLEASFSSEEIRMTASSEAGQSLSAEMDDYVVHFRLPDTLDLIAIVEISDRDEATQALLGRCILDASYRGEEIAFDALPETVHEAALKLMNESDPQADVQLDLCCPECDHKWQAAFDILSYLWKEIDAWAFRILSDVHLLASAYGWSEADILAMSNWRRQIYLDLVSR